MDVKRADEVGRDYLLWEGIVFIESLDLVGNPIAAFSPEATAAIRWFIKRTGMNPIVLLHSQFEYLKRHVLGGMV